MQCVFLYFHLNPALQKRLMRFAPHSFQQVLPTSFQVTAARLGRIDNRLAITAPMASDNCSAIGLWRLARSRKRKVVRRQSLHGLTAYTVALRGGCCEKNEPSPSTVPGPTVAMCVRSFSSS